MRSALPIADLRLERSAAPRRDASARTFRAGALLIALALALAAANQPQALDRGREIRSELLAAAGELSWQIVANPTEPVRQAIRAHFGEAEVEIDTARARPNVLVTLRGLSRATCETAVREARRMEGSVVVALEAYRSPADCGQANTMTWWIMP